jgi:hypothetical protein
MTLDMSEPKLGWNGASVKDSKLSVAIDGELPKGWEKSFEVTVRLLGGGDWGEVQLRKGSISVSDVAPGSEDKLKHFLESAVAQANADHRTDDEDSDEDSAEEADEDTGQTDEDSDMTSRFRSFGDGDAEED